MKNKVKYTIVIIFLLCNYSLTLAAPPKVTRFTLSNGIRVVNLYVEGTTDVVILSYLPLGLVTDGKAKTQWSHLIEHLTMRTTGPIDFKTSSAETMADNMRFDYLGNTENWMQGLKLQAKWLSNLPFSEESLAEELPRALSEIKYTEANLATHKWATAAWNQVFRHGQKEISMRGDLRSAQLSELQNYRNIHLVPSDRVLLCVIGGVETEILQTQMEEHIGSLKLSAKELPKASADTEKNQIAMWDVNVTHYVETYPIPVPANEDYPALYLAHSFLNIRLNQDIQLKELTGFVVCGVDLITPEQVYLQISASLKPDSDIEKVKQRIKFHIDQLKTPKNNASVAWVAPMVSKQFSQPMDIDMIKQHKVPGVTEAMMLGNIGIMWGMLEYQYGDILPKLAAAISNLSAEDVADVVNRYFTNEKRMTLVLKPRLNK